MEETTIIEEPTVVEEPTIIEEPVTVEEPTVVEQATPMDNNTTYTSLDPLQQRADSLMHIVNYDAREQKVGQSLNKFLTQDYDYDKEEAGSYWVAGAINDKDTQMSFLNTIVNEEMYDTMDLQKYYYDTTMATARAYAANKERETAYGYYRAAQEKAIAEAQLTGWYMPAEGQYMLMQYEAALDDLKNPEKDHTKANNVKAVTEAWFAANQITPRGIKCLSMMNYEENVRHNTIMGELQKEANKIAAQQAAASGAGNKASELEFRFSVEEMELATGVNFSKQIGLDNDNYIGHDVRRPEYAKYQALQGFNNVGELLKNPERFGQVLNATSVANIKNMLKSVGQDYDAYYQSYQAWDGDTILKESYEKNGNALSDKNLKATTVKIGAGETESGKAIKSFTTTDENGNPVTRLYYQDSDKVWHQIKKDIVLDNEQKASDFFKNFSTSPLSYDGEYISIGDAVNRSEYPGTYTSKAYKNINEKQREAIDKEQKKGKKVVRGLVSDKGMSTGIVMQDEKGNYFEVERDGKVQEIKDKTKLVDVYIDPKKTGTKIIKEIGKQSEPAWYDKGSKQTTLKGKKLEEDTKAKNTIAKFYDLGNNIYAYANSDNSIAFIEKKGDTYTVVSKDHVLENSPMSEQQLKRISQNTIDYQNGKMKVEAVKSHQEKLAENKTASELVEEISSGSSGGGHSSGGRHTSGYTAATSETKDASVDKFKGSEEKTATDILEAISKAEEGWNDTKEKFYNKINKVKEAK